MDVVEEGLEGLIQHVRIVVLELLRPLYGDEVVQAAGEAVHVVLLVPVESVAEVVGGVLDLESHVSADSSALGIEFHVFVHFEDGVVVGFESDVGEDAVVGVEELAEALEEEHVGVEFAGVPVLDAEEHVVVVLALALVDEAAELLLDVLRLPRVAQVVLLHPHRVQDGLVLPRLQVAVAQVLHLEQRLVDQLVL